MKTQGWTIESTEVDGQTESIYLVFGRPDGAKETMHWGQRTDKAHLLIDVDELDLPIAMQIVTSFSNEKSNATPSDFDCEKAVRELYGFANKMVAFHRAEEDAMSKPLIMASVDRARPLARAKRDQAAVLA